MENFETFEKNLQTNKNNDAVVLGLSIGSVLLTAGIITMGVLYYQEKQTGNGPACNSCCNCPSCNKQ